MAGRPVTGSDRADLAPDRQCPRITLVHGDAKPGNFAFLGDEVSAIFDWEMTAIGDPITDIGWMELLWKQAVGITSHPDAPSIDEFTARYQRASGIRVENRSWYRALNAFKMAVICLIGAMLFDDGVTDDQRFVLNASGIPLLTDLGLAELGVNEQLEPGPVGIRRADMRAAVRRASRSVVDRNCANSATRPPPALNCRDGRC